MYVCYLKKKTLHILSTCMGTTCSGKMGSGPRTKNDCRSYTAVFFFFFNRIYRLSNRITYCISYDIWWYMMMYQIIYDVYQMIYDAPWCIYVWDWNALGTPPALGPSWPISNTLQKQNKHELVSQQSEGKELVQSHPPKDSRLVCLVFEQFRTTC